MKRPRFRIGTLMGAVAFAGLVFAASRAMAAANSFDLFLGGLLCWPILTIHGTVWALEFSGRGPEDGGRSPEVGPRSRRGCELIILGSLTGVLATGIVSCQYFDEDLILFLVIGTLSLSIPAFAALLKWLIS